jgi:hypothetical protein
MEAEGTSRTASYSGPDVPTEAFPPGKVLAGRYRIDRFLGEGGMGAVYQATHLHLDHPVALKTLHRSTLARPEAREQFRQEAKLAIGLDHPNLVRVLDYVAGEPDLLVMELIDGTNVRRLLRDAGRLPAATAVPIAGDVLAGLASLHARGVVHRDVKPANVLVRRQDLHVKLSDFGLALDLGALRSRPGAVGGTPAYMAPEVVAGEPAQPAADVFALGVTLFEMLTGQLPWRGGTLTELWANMATVPAPPLSERAPGTPGEVARFVERCLKKDPHGRFPDGTQASLALKAVDTGPAGATRGRLFRNRLALVVRDESLAGVLATALGSAGVLAPVLTASTPADPRLGAILGELDAVLVELESAPAAVLEQFIGRVRASHPRVVFFLLAPATTRAQLVGRFSAEWRTRLGHYFFVPLDQPLSSLPAAIRDIAFKISFDQQSG